MNNVTEQLMAEQLMTEQLLKGQLKSNTAYILILFIKKFFVKITH